MVAGFTQAGRWRCPDSGPQHSNDPKARQATAAYSPDTPLLYGKLSPLEYLEFVDGLFGAFPPARAQTPGAGSAEATQPLGGASGLVRNLFSRDAPEAGPWPGR